MQAFFTTHRLSLLFFGLAIVAVLVKFAPFLFGQTLVFGDNYSLRVPGQLFSAQWLSQGIIPYWNPYIFSGINWIGDIHQSMLYPSSFLFAWLHPAVALNSTIVAHLLVGYVGMYLLARQLKVQPLFAFLAGCLWMFSTQVIGSVHNISTIQALPWLPMVIWAGLQVQHRAFGGVIFALVALLQFAAGYPQHSVYSIGIALLFSFVLGRKTSILSWVKAWLVTGLLTLGLTAAYWLPFIEAFFESTRMVQTIEQAQVGSLHPVMLAKMIIPALFDNAQLGMKWGPAWSGQPNVSFYFGWLALFVLGLRALAFKTFTKEEWFFASVAVSTLILSLGAYLPGYEFLQASIPLLQWGRYPSIFMIITAVVLILWIVKTLPLIKLPLSLMKVLLVVGTAAAVTCFALLITAATHMDVVWSVGNQLTGNMLEMSSFHTLAKDQVILQSVGRSALVAALFFVGSILALYYRKPAVLVTFIIFDVLLATQHMLQFAPNTTYNLPREWSLLRSPQFRAISRNGNVPYADFGAYWEGMVVREPFSDSYIDAEELRSFTHLQALRDGVTLDWNMVARVPMAHGYTALLPKDYGQIWETDSQHNINLIDYIAPSNPKLQDWAVRYYLVDTWYPRYGEVFSYPELWRDERYVVYALPALPRFRYPDGTAVELENFQENPNEISFKTINATAHTQMIVADRWDANWRATVNGKEVTVENSNGMRQMELPQGYAEVKLWFYPEKFYLGLKISVITIVGMLAWVSWRRFRSGLRFAE